jgi:hypothetical protein
VPVEDGGHAARATHAASGPLAELGARLGDNADLGHGSNSFIGTLTHETAYGSRSGGLIG